MRELGTLVTSKQQEQHGITLTQLVGAELPPPTQLVLSHQQGGGFWKMFTTRDIPCVNPCSNVPTFMQDNLELTFCSTKKGFGKCLRE